jgi:hypothetical protein
MGNRLGQRGFNNGRLLWHISLCVCVCVCVRVCVLMFNPGGNLLLILIQVAICY